MEQFNKFIRLNRVWLTMIDITVCISINILLIIAMVKYNHYSVHNEILLQQDIRVQEVLALEEAVQQEEIPVIEIPPRFDFYTEVVLNSIRAIGAGMLISSPRWYSGINIIMEDCIVMEILDAGLIIALVVDGVISYLEYHEDHEDDLEEDNDKSRKLRYFRIALYTVGILLWLNELTAEELWLPYIIGAITNEE